MYRYTITLASNALHAYRVARDLSGDLASVLETIIPSSQDLSTLDPGPSSKVYVGHKYWKRRIFALGHLKTAIRSLNDPYMIPGQKVIKLVVGEDPLESLLHLRS
jgi:hypothetical protein